MAKATIVSGSGVAPGYGPVRNTRRQSLLVGGVPNSIQSSLQLARSFRPTTPAYTPPASQSGGGGASRFDINNLPVDPTYDSLIGGYTRTRDNTLAGIRASRQSTLLNYGYQESGDPSNPSLAFDPSNPNSVAAQMKKRYDESKTGTNNSLAARGQLYSGALVNAQAANDSSYSTSSDSLQKQLTAFLQQNTRDQGQAQTDFETNAGSAYGDRVSRALSASAQNTSAPASSTPAPAAASSALDQLRAQQYSVQPGKNSRGQSGVWHTYPDGRRVFIVGAVR